MSPGGPRTEAFAGSSGRGFAGSGIGLELAGFRLRQSSGKELIAGRLGDHDAELSADRDLQSVPHFDCEDIRARFGG